MISRQLFQEVSSQVANLLGWDLYHHRLSDLKRGLTATAAELGVGGTPEKIERWIKTTRWSQRELDILSSHLTVGETYFFREQASLKAFQLQVIPEIMNRRSGGSQFIRLWSAGCCSGEEPYTLAILLNQEFLDLKDWNVHLLGTDVNQSFLEKARKGDYTQWSFRETPPYIQQKYFSKKDGVWSIDAKIKRMVKFSALNLADDLYPSAATGTLNMDVIFCRNVLMYFTPVQIKQVVKRFYNSLNNSGWLVTSAVELNDQYFGEFETVKFDSCILYHKNKVKPQLVISRDVIRNTPRQVRSGSTTLKAIRPPVTSGTSANHGPNPEEKPKMAAEQAKELFSQGKYEQCIVLCGSELNKSPDQPDLILFTVQSMANLGKLDQAHEWAEKLRTSPNVKAEHLYLYAHILLEKNDFGEALKNLKRALYLNPHHVMCHFLSGNIYTRLDNKPAGMKHYQNVRDLLSSYQADDLVPDSEGLTAGRLETIVKSLT